MNSKLKLKLYFILLVLMSFLLTLIAFVTSLFCHSSVLSLTALFHFSQLIFYTTKLYLLLRKEKNDDKNDGLKGPTRLGILIDMLCAVFVSALCLSIIVKSVEYFFGHRHMNEDEEEKKDDKLHHDHESMSQYEKILLMSAVGLFLFFWDIVFLVLNFKETVLRQKKRKNYAHCESFPSPGSNPNRTLCTDTDQINFKPFGNCKIRKENCYLIVPSDLVKMRRKVFFTLAFLSGPLSILINSLVYTINYDKEHHSTPSSDHHQSVNTSTSSFVTHQNHEHSHDHDDHGGELGGVLNVVVGFVLINIDPLLSIILCFIYTIFFVKIFKIAALILAQSVPVALDVESLKKDIKNIVPSIQSIHEFYLFEWTPFNLCISMHFVMEKNPNHTSSEDQQRDISNAIERIRDYFSNNYLIHSLVIQPEFVDPTTQAVDQCCEECHIKPNC